MTDTESPLSPVFGVSPHSVQGRPRHLLLGSTGSKSKVSLYRKYFQTPPVHRKRKQRKEQSRRSEHKHARIHRRRSQASSPPPPAPERDATDISDPNDCEVISHEISSSVNTCNRSKAGLDSPTSQSSTPVFHHSKQDRDNVKRIKRDKDIVEIKSILRDSFVFGLGRADMKRLKDRLVWLLLH